MTWQHLLYILVLKKSSDRTENLISRILDAVSSIWGRKEPVATIFYAFSPATELKQNTKGFFSFWPGLCLTSVRPRVTSVGHAATFIRQQNMLQFVCGSLLGTFKFIYFILFFGSALSEICLVLTTVSTHQHSQWVNVMWM